MIKCVCTIGIKGYEEELVVALDTFRFFGDGMQGGIVDLGTGLSMVGIKRVLSLFKFCNVFFDKALHCQIIVINGMKYL